MEILMRHRRRFVREEGVGAPTDTTSFDRTRRLGYPGFAHVRGRCGAIRGSPAERPDKSILILELWKDGGTHCRPDWDLGGAERQAP